MPVPPTRPWPLAQSRPTCPPALAPARWLVSHARRAGVPEYPPPCVPSYPSCASLRRSRPERAALRRGLQGAGVQYGCRRIGRSALRKPQEYAQIVDHLLEYAGLQPPPRLLVDGFPRRQVVRHVAPGGAGVHDPPQSIEHLAQIVVALWGVFSNERQVGDNKRPLFVGNVAWVCFSSIHARMLPLPGQSS